MLLRKVPTVVGLGEIKMIAVGIVMLFLLYLYDGIYGADYLPQRLQLLFGVAAIWGLSLIVAGVATFAWRYLP